MTNIWQFLMQTAEVTLTAAVLLLLKRIFQDKLSPRWQYGIWALLALKILIPVGTGGKYISMELAAALEAVKTMSERNLNSACLNWATPVTPEFPVPWISKVPQSSTDWLFAIYAAGVFLLLLRYIVSYVRLRLILRRGKPAGENFCEDLQRICEKYDLKPCRCIFLAGISSAFVCGVLRPVLVLPEQSSSDGSDKIDEKILLHELLHVKYFDVLQGIFWCFLRCLHWCNPLIWYVAGKITCDMESLCDQRVLERLSGEERRDYGRLLLSMTNEKYANVAGSTSLSNGGKNIAKRIIAIAHFKKYPKGMGLVSVCICILLAGPIFGNVSAMELPGNDGVHGWRMPGWDKEYGLAAANLRRCSTPAGAIDTYLKGLIYQDVVYLRAALPPEKWGAELEEVAVNSGPLVGSKCSIQNLQTLSEYKVYNLESEEKGEHHVQVVFQWNEPYLGEDMVDDDATWIYAIFPLRLDWDGRGWTVENDGAPSCYEMEDRFDIDHMAFPKVPWTQQWTAEGKNGTVRIEEQCFQTVYQGQAGLYEEAKQDAVFELPTICRIVSFESNWTENRKKTVEHIGMQNFTIEDTETDIEDLYRVKPPEDGSSSSSDGESILGKTLTEKWDGTIRDDVGIYIFGDAETSGCAGYVVRIFLNEELVETFKIKRGDGL